MTRESKSKMPSRLEAYTKIGKQTSAIGAFGIAAVAVTGAADAALQTWTVGQNFGYNNLAGTAGADLALTATFNSAFKVNFFNTGTVNQTNQQIKQQVLWAPNNNLSFINWGTANSVGANDPAQWRGAQTFGASANQGDASVFGGSYTVHSWFQAANSHTHSNDIAWSSFGDTPQGALAIGIRFDAGAGNYHYGWVEISNDANGAYSVERWAVETTANTAASYAPVPGPIGLTALALGAAGVRRSRKRSA
ncbi:MAG: hypothetical protein OSB69_03815 [Alphaproteobacteria bacterium]|nr:hypothetical protein [Alphaproteobacteria bacterium]